MKARSCTNHKQVAMCASTSDIFASSCRLHSGCRFCLLSTWGRSTFKALLNATFTLYGRKQTDRHTHTHTRLQYSPASVGLSQARYLFTPVCIVDNTADIVVKTILHHLHTRTPEAHEGKPQGNCFQPHTGSQVSSKHERAHAVKQNPWQCKSASPIPSGPTHRPHVVYMEWNVQSTEMWPITQAMWQ